MEDSDFRTVKLVPQGVTLNGPASSPGSSRFRIFENENTLGTRLAGLLHHIVSFHGHTASFAIQQGCFLYYVTVSCKGLVTVDLFISFPA